MRRRRRSTQASVVLIIMAVVVSAGAVACGSDSDLPPPPPSPGAQPAPEEPDLNLTPDEQQAVNEAQARFDAFMNDYINVSTADLPTADTAEDLFGQVDRHTAGLLSQDLRAEIVGRWGQRQVGSGTFHWNLFGVEEVDLGYEVNGERYPSILLIYCIDATDFEVVEASSGEPAGVSGLKQLWTYTVRWSDNWFNQGIIGWRVAERSEHTGQC